MRKLLILLSVVLFIALCQARPTTNVHAIRPKFIYPLNCTFGFKKVNGTKRCKTMTEFFEHPRNETNCTKLQKLKCYNYKNATACLCVKKPILPPHPIFPSRCPPGLTLRCKNRYFRDCKCEKFSPIRLNRTSLIRRRCKEGEGLSCPKGGACICKKIEKKLDIEPFIEPYVPTLPDPFEPMEPIEPLKPLEPMKPMEPF